MQEPLEDFTNALVSLKKSFEARNRDAAIEAWQSVHAKARRVIDWRVLRINMQDVQDKRPVHRRERQKARDLQKFIIQNTSPADLVQAAFGRQYDDIHAFCFAGIAKETAEERKGACP